MHLCAEPSMRSEGIVITQTPVRQFQLSWRLKLMLPRTLFPPVLTQRYKTERISRPWHLRSGARSQQRATFHPELFQVAVLQVCPLESFGHFLCSLAVRIVRGVGVKSAGDDLANFSHGGGREDTAFSSEQSALCKGRYEVTFDVGGCRQSGLARLEAEGRGAFVAGTSEGDNQHRIYSLASVSGIERNDNHPVSGGRSA